MKYTFFSIKNILLALMPPIFIYKIDWEFLTQVFFKLRIIGILTLHSGI